MTEYKDVWTEENIKKIVAAVHHYSATDREFRNLCLKDPNKAVEKVAGVPIPSSVNIKFIESDPDADMTYLLPDFISGGDELNDNELSQVSGGRGNPITDVVKIIVKPIEILKNEAMQTAQTGHFGAGLVCATVGAAAMPPGTGIPTGTGAAAGAVSSALDQNYGQDPLTGARP